MKKILSIIALFFLLTGTAFGAAQTIQATEEMVGAGHATKTDTLNRLGLVEHNTAGTHKAVITGLAVTAGKTITATQDTSLDEAVAMSSKGTVTYGDWTATLTCGTSGTITMGTYVTGYWTRIGKLVTIHGFFTAAAVSSPVGTLTLGGLPYTIANEAKYYSAGAIYMTNLADSTTDPQYQLIGNINAKTAVISKRIDGSAAAAAGDITSTSQIMVSLSYITSE